MIADPVAIENAMQRFAQREPDVVAAYLHGSYATGHADAESDIDIAILTKRGLPPQERHAVRMRAIYELSKILGEALSDKMDVIILQDIPVLLQYNVARKGRRLYERAKGTCAEFEVSVEQKYHDEEPYLRRETEMILDRILSRTAV